MFVGWLVGFVRLWQRKGVSCLCQGVNGVCARAYVTARLRLYYARACVSVILFLSCVGVYVTGRFNLSWACAFISDWWIYRVHVHTPLKGCVWLVRVQSVSVRDCRCCIHMSLLCVHVHTSLKDCCLVDVITSVTASLSLPYAHAYVTISLSLSLTSLKDCISVLCTCIRHWMIYLFLIFFSLTWT